MPIEFLILGRGVYLGGEGGGVQVPMLLFWERFFFFFLIAGQDSVKSPIANRSHSANAVNLHKPSRTSTRSDFLNK